MINPKDKSMLTVAGICVFIIFLFWALIYFPANRRLGLLRAEFNSIKREISAIESRGGKEGRDIAKMIESLQKDFNSAMQKLPAREEDTLRFISNEANRLGVEIIATQPRPKRPALDSGNSAIFIEGKQCFEIPVAIEARGIYKSIGEYLMVLRDGSPSLIKIEDARIQKDEAIAPRLKANLELALCILCET